MWGYTYVLYLKTAVDILPSPVTEIFLLFYRHANPIGYNANDVLSITLTV